MNLQKVAISVVLLVVVLGIVLVISASNSKNMTEAQVLVVPSQYPTIQAAIDDALDGSTILIMAGEYFENLRINKSITLLGSGIGATIVQGVDSSRFSNNSFDTYVALEIENESDTPLSVVLSQLEIHAFENPEIDNNDRYVGLYHNGASKLDVESALISGETGIRITGVGSGSLITISDSRIESTDTGIVIFGNSNCFGPDLFPMQLNIFRTHFEALDEAATSMWSSDACGTHTSIIQSTLDGWISLAVGGDMTIVNSKLESHSGIYNRGGHLAILSSTITANQSDGITISPYNWGVSSLELNNSIISNNGGYGLVVSGSECNPDLSYEALNENQLEDVHIRGRGNQFEGNALGDICPAKYPLPIDFMVH